jgi:hypothetical protein
MVPDRLVLESFTLPNSLAIAPGGNQLAMRAYVKPIFCAAIAGFRILIPALLGQRCRFTRQQLCFS